MTSPPTAPGVAALIEAYGTACYEFGAAHDGPSDQHAINASGAAGAAREALDAAIAGMASDLTSLALRLETAQHLADGLRERLARAQAAPPEGPRKPARGWVDRGDGYLDLIADHLRCHASPDRTIRPEAPFSWRVSAHLGSVEYVRASSYGAPPCETIEAAQLAAEDALEQIEQAIRRARGR